MSSKGTPCLLTTSLRRDCRRALVWQPNHLRSFGKIIYNYQRIFISTWWLRQGSYDVERYLLKKCPNIINLKGSSPLFFRTLSRCTDVTATTSTRWSSQKNLCRTLAASCVYRNVLLQEPHDIQRFFYFVLRYQ